MTIDPEFFELMPVVLSISEYTGQDAFGNNTYGAPTTHRARVESLNATMLVTTADGGTALARPGESTTLIIDYVEPQIVEGSKVEFDEGGRTRTLRVTSQIVHYDENGPYYQELTCANNQEP